MIIIKIVGGSINFRNREQNRKLKRGKHHGILQVYTALPLIIQPLYHPDKLSLEVETCKFNNSNNSSRQRRIRPPHNFRT